MKRIFYVVAIVVILVLSGCSSKRAVSTRKVETSTQISVTETVPSTSRQVAELLAEARSWIGTPYEYGGHSRSGTDCSGFMMEIFGKVYGVKLPRSSAMQQQYARSINDSELSPGDLIFFATGGDRSQVSHVGLYVGDGRMVHASASKGVMESALDINYWRNSYHSSGRVIDTDIRRQELYNELDHQIDSIYVSEPEIFD